MEIPHLHTVAYLKILSPPPPFSWKNPKLSNFPLPCPQSISIQSAISPPLTRPSIKCYIAGVSIIKMQMYETTLSMFALNQRVLNDLLFLAVAWLCSFPIPSKLSLFLSLSVYRRSSLLTGKGGGGGGGAKSYYGEKALCFEPSYIILYSSCHF